MTDFYHDTDERMQTDASFYQAVRMLEVLAREHGFTPGELKQIAFRAALELEMCRDGQRYYVSQSPQPASGDTGVDEPTPPGYCDRCQTFECICGRDVRRTDEVSSPAYPAGSK